MLQKNIDKLERKRKPTIPYKRVQLTKKQILNEIEKKRGKDYENQS